MPRKKTREPNPFGVVIERMMSERKIGVTELGRRLDATELLPAQHGRQSAENAMYGPSKEINPLMIEALYKALDASTAERFSIWQGALDACQKELEEGGVESETRRSEDPPE